MSKFNAQEEKSYAIQSVLYRSMDTGWSPLRAELGSGMRWGIINILIIDYNSGTLAKWRKRNEAIQWHIGHEMVFTIIVCTINDKWMYKKHHNIRLSTQIRHEWPIWQFGRCTCICDEGSHVYRIKWTLGRVSLWERLDQLLTGALTTSGYEYWLSSIQDTGVWINVQLTHAGVLSH